MTPEEADQIRAMPWKDGPDPELVIRIVTYWNAGHSTNHIVELLGLEDKGAVMRPIASVRVRTDVALRKLDIAKRDGVPEHPSWWTTARTNLGKSLWEGGEIRNGEIAKRLGTCLAAVSAKAVEAGWERVIMTPVKKGKRGIRPADRAVSNNVVSSMAKGIVWEALPGTEPIPFWQVPLHGACNWILGDSRGAMAEALCCAAPTDKGQRYCPTHTARGISPLASGKPRTGHELARSLRRFA